MIDLHTHSIFSDGELIPSELVRRAKVAGYRAIAITDHTDHSNIDIIIPALLKVCDKLSGAYSLRVLPGVELTHVPPEYIRELAIDARGLGAKIIVVHGETIAEPVIQGTNLAALNAPIDILAHPGLLTEEEARLAALNSIYLEVTTRKGHSLTNGHVVRLARDAKAALVINTDTHSPQDLTGRESAMRIALGAGMTEKEALEVFRNSETIVSKYFRP